MANEAYVDINQEQFKMFMQLPKDEAVVMLNYLKFKDTVAETGLSGRASYKEYMRQATPFFNKANATVLFWGRPKHMLIGPEEGALWDEVLLVRYESVTDFFAMVKAEGYPSHLRKQALEDSRLIHCKSNR